MIWKIIIILLILSCISVYWDEKIKKSKNKRRTYKLMMGLTYFVTAIISVFAAKYFDEIIYLYTILGLIFSVGSALSAINPNLRNMYTCLLIYGLIALIISFYFDSHKIIFTIIDISLACGFVVSVIDGIQNMRNGLDPDLLEAERQREKKFKRLFTLSRLLIRFWRW